MFGDSEILQKIALFLLIVLVISFVFAPLVHAEEGGKKAKKQQSLWDVIKAGGSIGFFIIGLSMVGVALVIEHFLTIRKDQLVPPDVYDAVIGHFDDEEYEEAMELCAQNPNFFTKTLHAGLNLIGRSSFDQVEAAIAEAADTESLKLHQKIGYISLIANLAPMLGLLGTVTGMIAAFQVIANSEGSPSPSELADSIGMALVTTAEGLIVAIPLTAAFFFFRNRIIRITTEVVEECNELVDRFRDME